MDHLVEQITFEPEGHIYRLNGRVLQHVTGVLSAVNGYDKIPAEYLVTAAQKGNAVHKLIELLVRGINCDIPEWMLPVYQFWQKFVAETGFRVIASELRVYHPVWNYAGTLDLVCELPGTKYPGPGIIDLKRSFLAGDAIGLQLAAYKEAYEDTTGQTLNWRCALRLREDGPYRLVPYESPRDMNDFVTCLAMARLMQRMKR